MPAEIICDVCRKFKSFNSEDFRIIAIQEKVTQDWKIKYLCEQKCFKVFRKFWIDADKEEAIKDNNINYKRSLGVSNN